MADVVALTSHFQRAARLSAPTYHKLILDYPAVELLPFETPPVLATPQDAAFREEPDVATWLADGIDIDFFTYIPVDRSAPPADAPDNQHQGNISTAIKRLSHAPGISTFHIIGYAGENQIMYRARLSTEWEFSPGDANEVKDFEFGKLEWTMHRSEEPWMQLLTNLMQRVSVRAYFYVQRRILQYSLVFEHEEEVLKWDSQPLLTAKERLHHKLNLVRHDQNSESYEDAIRDLAEVFEGAHAVSVYFPCSHSHLVPVSLLQNLSEAECMQFGCHAPGCGAYVLDEEDVRLAEVHSQKEERALFASLQAMWRDLDGEVPVQSGATTVKTEAVRDALNLALVSLQMPKSVVPLALCPTRLPEMDAVMAAFRQSLANEGTVDFAMTPRELYERLLRLAVTGLGGSASGDVEAAAAQVMRPRFETFLKRWLTRAINYTVWAVETVGSKKEIDGLAELMMGMVLRQGVQTARSRG